MTARLASHPSCKAASDVGPVAAANDRGPTTSAEMSSCTCDRPGDPPDIPHRPWCATETYAKGPAVADWDVAIAEWQQRAAEWTDSRFPDDDLSQRGLVLGSAMTRRGLADAKVLSQDEIGKRLDTFIGKDEK